MDTLLERDPAANRVVHHPAEAIINDVMAQGQGEVQALENSPDSSTSSSELSSSDDDSIVSDDEEEEEEDRDEADNHFNSAGEEVCIGHRSFSDHFMLLSDQRTVWSAIVSEHMCNRCVICIHVGVDIL